MHANRTILARVLPVAIIIGVLMMAATGVANAHERREVGDFTFVVGFGVEPALVDEPNSLSLRVTRGQGDAAEPVEGLQETLEAEIIYGGETMPLELRGAFNDPGHYVADVIPTATGTYSFRILGTIEGTEVDETFTGGPDTFSEVEGKESMSFPGGDGGSSGASAGEAQDTADMAQTIAIVALIAGLLGLGAGIAALLMARGSRTASDVTGD